MNRSRLILLIVLALPNAAAADSDGYYCIGPRYIAWQFGLASPSTRPHELFVVQYGNGVISESTSILLPQFQVHGMRCRENTVDVASFTGVHTVMLDAEYRPISVTEERYAGDGRPGWALGIQSNLARLSSAYSSLTPDRNSLLVEPNGDEYILDVSAAPDSVRECPPTITVRILRYDRAGIEQQQRTLLSWTEHPQCTRPSYAPVAGTGAGTRDPMEVLLDALVFGPHGQTDVSVYAGELRREFETWLRRFDAYRTPRPPVGGGLEDMVDGARTRYERRLVASSSTPDAIELAVGYVEELRPCYEWEGFHDCPEREALFADAYLERHPNGPFSDYLPLLSGHRWACAADAFDYENRPEDAARSRQISAARLAAARSSRSLLIRTAAEQLARRNRCLTR
jgi:hypothetical protein